MTEFESHYPAEFKEKTSSIVTRAILVNDEGKVLLGKRVRGGGVGKWALPGGKPDGNESTEEAVVREVKEELGVDFSPELFDVIKDNKSPDRAKDDQESWDVYTYKGKFAGTPIFKPDEISELIAVSESDLDNLGIAFNHKELLQKFFSERS